MRSPRNYISTMQNAFISSLQLNSNASTATPSFEQVSMDAVGFLIPAYDEVSSNSCSLPSVIALLLGKTPCSLTSFFLVPSGPSFSNSKNTEQCKYQKTPRALRLQLQLTLEAQTSTPFKSSFKNLFFNFLWGALDLISIFSVFMYKWDTSFIELIWQVRPVNATDWWCHY